MGKINQPHDKYFRSTFGRVDFAKDFLNNYLPDEIKRYIPNFKYMLSDLSYPDREANLDEEHSIVTRTLNHARYASRDEMLDIFTEAITIFTKNKDMDMVGYYIIESMTYVLSVRDDISAEELIEAAGKISIEGGELAMTAAEKLRQEGMEKGIKKGKEEGERIATLDNALTLLTLKFGTISASMKEQISQLDIFVLKLIVSEIFSYENIEDINKYLK